ncbi:MAG: PcfK-like protein [Bacteroides sp.]|nr:PcfK-like protein [Bacteroides sp.]
MEPNFTSFEVVIKNYLDKRAETDQEFAKTYAKPNKSIKECCTYIFSVVEKQRKSGEKCLACSDDEIFGLAVHYYDEDDIVVEAPKAKIKAVAGEEGEELVKSGEVEVVATTSTPNPKTRKPRKPKAEVDPNIPEPLDIPIF